jgi:hypothetical protein
VKSNSGSIGVHNSCAIHESSVGRAAGAPVNINGARRAAGVQHSEPRHLARCRRAESIPAISDGRQYIFGEASGQKSIVPPYNDRGRAITGPMHRCLSPTRLPLLRQTMLDAAFKFPRRTVLSFAQSSSSSSSSLLSLLRFMDTSSWDATGRCAAAAAAAVAPAPTPPPRC